MLNFRAYPMGGLRHPQGRLWVEIKVAGESPWLELLAGACM